MLMCTSCFNGDTIICECKSKISEMCNHQKFSQFRDAVIVICAYHLFVLLGWTKLLLECELRQTIHITIGHRRKCVKHLQFMSRAMGQNNNWVLQVILIFIYVLANSIDRFFFKKEYTPHYRTNKCPLVDALGGRHGSLDGQASNVLPALLEQGDEVVDGQHDVTDELVLGHLNVANSDTHTQNLLQLELDGGLDLGDLVGEVLSVRDGGGELAGCCTC